MSEVQTRHCIYCGTLLRPEAAFCPQCGAQVRSPVSAGAEGQERSEEPESSPNQKTPSRRWLVPLIVCVAVVVLGGGATGGYFLFRGSDQSQTDPVVAVASVVRNDLEDKGYDPTALEVHEVAIFGDWAVASVRARAGDADEAQVVTRRDGSTWVVVAGPATTFTRSDLSGAPLALLASLVLAEEEIGTGETAPGEATTLPSTGATASSMTSTTVAEGQTAYWNLGENLAAVLREADARIPELATEINATLPDVPESVLAELGEMAGQVSSALMQVETNPVPAGYEEAKANLESAAAWMMKRIGATANGIAAAWETGAVTAATPYFEEGREARDAYREALSKYESTLPRP